MNTLTRVRSLSTQQKRFILHTLELQARADAGDQSSLDIVNYCFCHAAVYCLEQNILTQVPATQIPMNFRTMDTVFHNPVEFSSLVYYLNHLIRETSTAQVIHIFKYNDNHLHGHDTTPLYIFHSIVALGEINHQFIAWEKQAKGRPFVISPLAEIFAKYSDYCWGIRPLRHI